jgi:nifR3 family TIM-barrel protein
MNTPIADIQSQRNLLQDKLNTPLCIGGKSIPQRLVLAPMTYLGHIAYRELLSSFGECGLLFSEMCSAKTIPHENQNVSAFFRWNETERSRLAFQLFGSEPDKMAAAAQRIQSEGLFGVDINFGCSVKSIIHRNCGASLLKSPERAVAIVTAVRKAIAIPLFVKFRTGWQDSPHAAVDMAQRFEDAGADALTFHPRVAPDRRSRPPKWEYIGLVKDAVSIPVFGNGNVFSAEDCLNMLRLTGCDGVAIGRMAIARPWLFAQWSLGFIPPRDIYQSTIKELIRLLPKYFEPSRAMRRLKRFALYYAGNFRFGHVFYSKMRNAACLEEANGIVDQFFATDPEITNRPNMNFFH